MKKVRPPVFSLLLQLSGERIEFLGSRIAMRLLVCTCIFVLLAASQLLAAQPTPKARRSAASPSQDPAAVAVLNQAIAAMGGQSSSGSVLTVQIVGSATLGADMSGTVITATSTYQTTPAGYEFRRETVVGSTDTIFVSGYGSPARSFRGIVSAFSPYVGAAVGPTQMPLMVLNQVVSNGFFTATMGASAQIGGVNATHVQISNSAIAANQPYTVEDWFFDPSTGLPLEVQCVVPDVNDSSNNLTGTEDFASWQNVSGVLVPFQVTDSLSGSVLATLIVSSVSINPVVDPSLFQLDLTNAKVRR